MNTPQTTHTDKITAKPSLISRAGRESVQRKTNRRLSAKDTLGETFVVFLGEPTIPENESNQQPQLIDGRLRVKTDLEEIVRVHEVVRGRRKTIQSFDSVILSARLLS